MKAVAHSYGINIVLLPLEKKTLTVAFWLRAYPFKNNWRLTDNEFLL